MIAYIIFFLSVETKVTNSSLNIQKGLRKLWVGGFFCFCFKIRLAIFISKFLFTKLSLWKESCKNAAKIHCNLFNPDAFKACKIYTYMYTVCIEVCVFVYHIICCAIMHFSALGLFGVCFFFFFCLFLVFLLVWFRGFVCFVGGLLGFF